MRVVSFITEPPVVRNILEHLKRTGTEAARAPEPVNDFETLVMVN